MKPSFCSVFKRRSGWVSTIIPRNRYSYYKALQTRFKAGTVVVPYYVLADPSYSMACSYGGNSESRLNKKRIGSHTLWGFYQGEESVNESNQIWTWCNLFSCLCSLLFNWILLAKPKSKSGFIHRFPLAYSFASRSDISFPRKFYCNPLLCCMFSTWPLLDFLHFPHCFLSWLKSPSHLWNPRDRYTHVAKYMLINRRDNPVTQLWLTTLSI